MALITPIDVPSNDTISDPYDLLGEPAAGYYWKFQCGWVSPHETGSSCTADENGDSILSHPSSTLYWCADNCDAYPDYPVGRPPNPELELYEGPTDLITLTENCSDCSESYTSCQVIRWTSTTFDVCAFRDVHQVGSLYRTYYSNTAWRHYLYYIYLPCEDLDIQFPATNNNYTYSETVSELDTGRLTSLYSSCSDLYGQIETAYINCTNLYRCKSRPYWKWDDNQEIWIPPNCLSVKKLEEYIHSDGNDTYIYAGKTWTYRVYSEDEDFVFLEDTVMYLSYAGSTAINGIDFSSPNSVIMEAGKNYVDFELTVFNKDTAYGKFINIEATSEFLETCETVKNQILFEKTIDDLNDLCSDIFFWQEPTCDGFFRPEEYTKFEIKRKGS